MSVTRYSIQIVDGVPVVTAPAGLDAAAGGQPARDGERGVVADSRPCEQCGVEFAPQREHARFCSADCRARWNREHMGDPAVESSALAWSVTAMSEAAGRLPQVKAWDRPQALAAIGEAVWWITMVDATLVRHHPAVYDAVLTAQAPAERQLIEETLAGLRFIRNWMGREAWLGEVVETGGMNGDHRPVMGWTWKDAPEPPLGSLPPRRQAWEMARYRAYQTYLVGHTIGDTFGRAMRLLALTGVQAASGTDASWPGMRSDLADEGPGRESGIRGVQSR